MTNSVSKWRIQMNRAAARHLSIFRGLTISLKIPGIDEDPALAKLTGGFHETSDDILRQLGLRPFVTWPITINKSYLVAWPVPFGPMTAGFTWCATNANRPFVPTPNKLQISWADHYASLDGPLWPGILDEM